MGDVILDVSALVARLAVIVWGAETFAEHLASAAAHLGVTSSALALLMAGAAVPAAGALGGIVRL